MAEEHVYTVTELNQSARDLLESGFGGVWVKGELSEVTYAPSGHLYVTLKDENAELSAVRFRSRSPILRNLEIGTVVLAFGKLTVYEPRGRYQFVATLLQPVGAGARQAAFEFLKRKLSEEGLFDASLKRSLPAYPSLIGVVTSPSGAALHDIASVLRRRWPAAEILLFPSSVQGEAAPADLMAALDQAARYSQTQRPIDLIILGRGGGSAEDLAAFNDEQLARAVRAHPVPIVSAVGHEIDFAITDFVADLRAPTPTAAAELVTPDASEIRRVVDGTVARMARAVQNRWSERNQQLRSALRASLLRVPRRMIDTFEQSLDTRVSEILRGARDAMLRDSNRLRRLSDVLRLSDPRLPLARGYSITSIEGESMPLRNASAVKKGGRIVTQLAHGRLTSSIEEVVKE
jgi:exodeoxyribonuclease VII large subunit